MSLTEQVNAMEQLLATAKAEITALESGKKAASARARKSLMSVKASSHTLRKNIAEYHKGMSTKKRTPVGATAAAVEAGNVPLDVEEPILEDVLPVEKAKPKLKRTRTSKPKVEK